MVEVDPYLRNFEEKSLGRGAGRGGAGGGERKKGKERQISLSARLERRLNDDHSL